MANNTLERDALRQFIPKQVADKILENPVDAYFSYTYRLTFSMLPYSFYSTPEVDLSFGTTGVPGGARIVIAQTGVTKFQIDNLQISSVVSNTAPKKLRGNRVHPFVATFTLTEPYGMSYIDLLNRTAYELNKDLPQRPSLQTMPYLLEIELIGQKDPMGEEPESPELGEVFYHTAIPARVIDFGINPSAQGTEYETRVVPIHNMVPIAEGSVTTVPEDMTVISDGTVASLFENFSEQMNTRQNSIQKVTPSQKEKGVGIDTGVYKLADHGMPNLPTLGELEISEHYFNKPLESSQLKPLAAKTISQISQDGVAGDDQPADDGQNNKTLRVDIIKGAKVEDIMISFASLNDEFCKLCTRYDTPPEASELDIETLKKDQTQYIIPHVYTTSEWDGKSFKKDNKIALSYTYHLTGKLDSSIVIDPEELKEEGDGKDQGPLKKAAEDRSIMKFYAYQFTGLNDQVYDVDLKHEYGIRYLTPGYGGQQSNYTSSAAVQPSSAANKKVKDSEAGKTVTTENEMLDKFVKIATDLKSVVTSLAMLPITITQDLQALATGLKPDGTQTSAGKVRQLNQRLPSSPIAVLQKLDTVTNLTSEISELKDGITSLQEEIEGVISETIDKQISEIMSKAFTPFDIIDSKLNKIGSGINDFIDKVESVTGEIGLDQFGINTNSLLDEAKEAVDEITSKTTETATDTDTTPTGFSSGARTSIISEMTNTYMEEYEFDSTVYGNQSFEQGSPFGEADTTYKNILARETGLIGPATTFANRSIFSTMLSNTRLGAPYMLRTSFEVKGDPYWLGTPTGIIKDKKFKMTPGEEFQGDLKSDVKEAREEAYENNTAPYGIGEVNLFFVYLFPREYDMWDDNPNTHTGEVKDLNMNQSFSGQFQVFRVIHNFSGGKFTQTLDAFKQIYKGQLPQADIDREKQEQIQEQLATTLPTPGTLASGTQFDADGNLVLDSGNLLENAINNINFTESDLVAGGYENPLTIASLNGDGG